MIPTLQVGKPRHTEVIYSKSLRKSENRLTTEPGKITFQRLVQKKKKKKNPNILYPSQTNAYILEGSGSRWNFLVKSQSLLCQIRNHQLRTSITLTF